MESRHTSRYFFRRAGRKHSARLWTKLTVVCDTRSHFLAAAAVSLGPANDAPQFRPAMRQASRGVTWDRVLADAAFDSEESHRLCREGLGVRSTVIPLNRRGRGRRWPKTRYRRQTVKRFRKKPRGSRHKRVYGQRWQVETCQADYPSSRRWVGTRGIGYHRRDGVARAGRVVPAAPGRPHRRSCMSDTTRHPTPPRA